MKQRPQQKRAQGLTEGLRLELDENKRGLWVQIWAPRERKWYTKPGAWDTDKETGHGTNSQRRHRAQGAEGTRGRRHRGQKGCSVGQALVKWERKRRNERILEEGAAIGKGAPL
uniref:Uncharacterized protein n=1 Tax=Pyxicephalus adspersus TaxID=30357 RepID=A0AAV2ZGR7_PYXAD|nr:TPA: hypothetical protein GDO54_005628 [Pyxicephalus adspersus]